MGRLNGTTRSGTGLSVVEVELCSVICVPLSILSACLHRLFAYFNVLILSPLKNNMTSVKEFRRMERRGGLWRPIVTIPIPLR